MLRFYPAVINKEAQSDYGVFFPDFPGCVTAEATLADALRSATEALALHIEGMVQDGEAIPEPSDPTMAISSDFWIAMVPVGSEPARYEINLEVHFETTGPADAAEMIIDRLRAALPNVRAATVKPLPTRTLHG